MQCMHHHCGCRAVRCAAGVFIILYGWNLSRAPTGWIGGTTARQPCAPWMPRTRPSACPWGSTLGELPGHVYIIIYEISPICGEVHWEMPSACSPGVLFIRARTSGCPLHIYEIISSKDSYYVRSGLGKYENHANFCIFPHGYLYFPRARKCTKI